jgi:hypothetical protein
MSENAVGAAKHRILGMPLLCRHLDLDVKRGEAAKKDLKAIGINEEQTKRV